jgi:hypothetical protein
MNIFYLHPDPVIAASMHCDQHLHKMILESAQLLSTWVRATQTWRKDWHDTPVYKSSYYNHPCNEVIRQDPNYAMYVYVLANNLNQIRLSLGSNDHASMECLHFISNFIEIEQQMQTPHRTSGDTEIKAPIFCGPAIFKLDNARYLTIPEKYQAYYLYKAKQWALDGKPCMSYRDRPVPAFLQGNEYVTIK